MKRTIKIAAAAIVLLSALAFRPGAQPFDLRTDSFRWHIARTEHFDIYFYPEARFHIPRISRILENTYRKVTDFFGIEFDEPVPFFLYLNHNHFEQNTITTTGEGVGGFSEPYKNRFVMPLYASDRELEKIITHEFTHIASFQVLYGGFWKSVSLLKFVFYPLWFQEGLCEYVSENWDAYGAMILRDAAAHNGLIPLYNLHNFNHLKSTQIYLAYKQSHSAVGYIAEEFGSQRLSEMLFNLRDSVDISSVLIKSIKLDLKRFNTRWQKYIKEKTAQEIEGMHQAHSYGKQITFRKRHNTRPRWSPDGKSFAYLSSDKGYTDIIIKDEATGRERRLLRNAQDIVIDLVKEDGHAIAWHPDGCTLAYVGERNRREYLYFVCAGTGKTRRIDSDFEVISSVSFSPCGASIAASGSRYGFFNLYLYTIEDDSWKQLTFDNAKTFYPAFSPDGRHIVFAREMEGLQLDLFMLDIDTLKIRRISDTAWNERTPLWSPDGRIIYFISDKDDMFALCGYYMDTGRVVQLSGNYEGMLYPDLHPDADQLLFSVYRYGGFNIWKGRISEFPEFSGGIRLYAKTGDWEEQRVVSIDFQRDGISGFTDTEDYPQTPTPLKSIKPYRLQASTDLIFPFLFYSTASGFYSGAYWQLSDMLAHHNLGLVFEYASYENWFNYSAHYIYRGLKPDIGINALGRTRFYLNYLDELIKQTSYGFETFVRFPITRQDRVGASIYTANTVWINRDRNNEKTQEQEHAYALTFNRHTARTEIFQYIHGDRFSLSYYHALPVMGADLDYKVISGEHMRYWSYGDRNTLALRMLGATSLGYDRQIYNLGWYTGIMNTNKYTIRGFRRNTAFGSRLAVYNLELRYNLIPEINYDTWFFWPSFFIKNIEAVAFTDGAWIWDDIYSVNWYKDWKRSFGIGMRCNLFILQMYPLILRFDHAWRMDTLGGAFYFSLGQHF